MYNGMICRIIGVTYSHPEYRGSKPFYSYHLMPEGGRSLKDSIQYQTVDKLAFEPPKSYLSEIETDRKGDASTRKDEGGALDIPAAHSSPTLQWSDQLGTVSTDTYEFVRKSTVFVPTTNSDKFITIDDAPYLELVKG
jgi:hypothetical protein